METPDVTRAQILGWLAIIAAIAAVLGSPEYGLGDSPPWVRLVIAAALVGGYAVFHLIADAKIRVGRAGVVASTNEVAAAQLKQLAARPEGDDSLVDPTPPSK